MAKWLYNTREHQYDSSGNRSEKNKPICTRFFSNTLITSLLVKAQQISHESLDRDMHVLLGP